MKLTGVELRRISMPLVAPFLKARKVPGFAAGTIVGGQSGRCVDVPNASTSNGTPSTLSFSIKFFRASSQRCKTQMHPLTAEMWFSTRCSSVANGFSTQFFTDARISSI